jgi:hypothetical protein
MKHFLSACLIVLFAISSSAARPQSPVAYNAFDGIAPGGRSLAMGLAATAVGNDPADIYFNPAGLALLTSDNVLGLSFEAARQSELNTDQLFSNETLKDSNLTLVGLCNSKGAVSWRPMAAYTTSTSTVQGDVSSTEVHIDEFTLSATQTDGKVTNGLNLSYLYGRVAQTGIENGVPSANIAHGNGFSLGYGLLFSMSSMFRIGIAAENIAAFMWWDDFETQQPPFNARVGFAYQISEMVTFAYDFDKRYYREPNAAVSQNHFGLEQNLGDTLKVRIGIFGPNMNDLETTHYTAGLGYSQKDFNFDISGEKYRVDLVDVYRIVLGLSVPL